jgi:tRNA(Ile)-lysidine synthase
MAYSARLRKAIGAVRSTLESVGLGAQSPEFARHGEHETAPDAPRMLVACSGGRDSMAMAAVCQIVCASIGVRCGAVIVDHALQSGSEHVAEQAAQRCRSLGLDPVIVRRAAVREQGEGLEAAAREARYAQICDVAHGTDAVAVALAHTMDDQAETVLIGLLRNKGIDALAGMPPTACRDGVTFLRPFLGLARADTTGICEDLGIAYWDDPTNGDSLVGALPDGFPLRSRIRHDLVPAIERFAGPSLSRHLAQSARLARLDKDYLDQCANRVLAQSAVVGRGVEFDAKRLQGEPSAIRLRVIAHALAQGGIDAGSAQVEAIDRLVVDWHGQGAVALSSGYSANRKKHVIRVCQDGAHANR